MRTLFIFIFWSAGLTPFARGTDIVGQTLSCSDLLKASLRAADLKAVTVLRDLHSTKEHQISLLAQGTPRISNFESPGGSESEGIAAFLYRVAVSEPPSLVDFAFHFRARSLGTPEGAVPKISLELAGIRGREPEFLNSLTSAFGSVGRSMEARAHAIVRGIHTSLYSEASPFELFGVEWNGTFGVSGLVPDEDRPFVSVGYRRPHGIEVVAVLFRPNGKISEIRRVRAEPDFAVRGRVRLN